MTKMLVVSGLIEAQKSGNQSFKSTILGLDRRFEVSLLSLIPRDRPEFDYDWYSETSVKQLRPNSFSLYSSLKGKHKFLGSLLSSIFRNRSESKLEKSAVSDFDVFTSFFMDVANFAIALVLFIKIIIYRLLYGHFKILYCYEVPASIAGIWCSLFFKNTLIVRRFQGTALTTEMLGRCILFSHQYAMRQLFWQSFDYFIVANDGTQGEKIISNLNVRANIFFVPNGLPDYVIEYRKPPNPYEKSLEDSELRLVCVSKHKKWKRVDRVIKFAARLSERSAGVRLTVIGDGPMTGEWTALADELSIQFPKLLPKFVGSCTHKNCLSAISDSDLFLSFYDVSNLANPLFEAFCIGIPIVTFHSEPIYSIFEDRINYCPFFDDLEDDNLLHFISHFKLKQNLSQDEPTVLSWSDRMERECDWLQQL
jgi:glycosyltransferase involved in cell wall biosynthesis